MKIELKQKEISLKEKKEKKILEKKQRIGLPGITDCQEKINEKKCVTPF